MKKISIIGCFALGTDLFDGQTIKTRTISNELSKIYGDRNISNIDTFLWKRKIFKLLKNIMSQFKNSDSVIMLPAKNGLKVFAPLLMMLNYLYKRKLSYIVIGGWLYEYIKDNKYLVNSLKKFDSIFVETKKMKSDLEKIGFENIYILPNFKSIEMLDCDEILEWDDNILNICTFSRVMKEKGITRAIDITKKLKAKGVNCKLDIFGKVDEKYKNEFFELLDTNKLIVEYKGAIDANESVNVLKHYNIMLFLTYYEGEGFPGTLIDALFAGVPVIASDWKYNNEIVQNKKTGYLVNMNEEHKVIEYLIKLDRDRQLLKEMKIKCLEEAKKYTSSKLLPELIERI